MGETLTSKLDRARSATRMRCMMASCKKGTSVPYLGHLMGVSSIVLDDGGSEDEAVAALLHDAAEDHGGRARLDDIRSRFGDEVARIVEDCTDSWDTPKPSWLARKQAYIQRARTLPSPSLRVSIADKVHNTYGILRDLRNIGEKVWERYDVSRQTMCSRTTSHWCGRIERLAAAGSSTSSSGLSVESSARWDTEAGEVRAGKQIRSRRAWDRRSPLEAMGRKPLLDSVLAERSRATGSLERRG